MGYPLTIRKSDDIDDWYVIERAEHDGRQWLEKTEYGYSFMTSARIGNADVEGTRDEMLAIAKAVEDRTDFHAGRCAVEFDSGAGQFQFSSPRNSIHADAHTTAVADALAAEIRALLES